MEKESEKESGPAPQPVPVSQGKRINRRRALKRFGIGVVTGTAAYVASRIHRDEIREMLGWDTDAERFLRDFPSVEELPGAGTIEKIPHSNARQCLVHIRQLHGVPHELPLDRHQEIMDIQSDIITILLNLTTHPAVRLTEVYTEGLTVREEEAVNGDPARAIEHLNGMRHAELSQLEAAFMRCLRQRNALLLSQLLQPASSGPGLVQLQYLLPELQSYATRLSSAYEEYQEERKLQQEKGVQFINLELAQRLQVRGTDAKGLLGRRDWNNPAVLEAREDDLLEIVSRNNAPFAVTIYGGGHDWRNNIERWNAVNTDKKFSLIKVTPRRYA